MRKARLGWIAATALLVVAGVVCLCSTEKDDSEEAHRRAIMNGYKVFAPSIPDTLTFAGESVPLATYYVREGLDNELIVNMYRQSSTVLYFKRASRYFPVIEPILKKNGIPSDFKYLCVIESGLTNATSPAKAQGFWQFIASTGANYGLMVNDEIDMRDNLAASTEAACKYLRSLYNKFHSWTAAAAAYNCGENGLARRIDRQGTDVYYDIWLNTETSRYVYRILDIKLIMQNPRQYGYYLRKCDLYQPVPTRKATLSGQNIDLYQFARSHGTNYKMLRMLNPWIKTDMLKNKANKTYTVDLPVENGTLYRTLTKGKKDTGLLTTI